MVQCVLSKLQHLQKENYTEINKTISYTRLKQKSVPRTRHAMLDVRLGPRHVLISVSATTSYYAT